MAEWFRPQLAVLVDAPPAGDTWLHEIKFDGYRAGCAISADAVTLTSRNGVDLKPRFPSIVEAARRLPVRTAHLDGEVVALLPDGHTSFHALQHWRPGAPPPAGTTLAYMVFDALMLDGESLQPLPLVDRKARLAALLERHPTPGVLRYSSHIVGQGPAFFEQARHLGLEGVVSKRADLPYRPGRSDAWRKAKCTRSQEFVIGGFTDQTGTRAALGALLLGCYDGDALVFAGRVGTGWSDREAAVLRRDLETLATPVSPFSRPLDAALARTAHWVAPRLVAQVTFTEWTPDGLVRHPAFKGLRLDRDPADVRREDATRLD